MANRFWVGGTGNWSDATNHWSASSGGSPGASLPTVSDSVFFDANSFSSAGRIITVDVSFHCLDMDWTGAINSPTIVGSQNGFIAGSLTLISGMTLTYTGGITFQSTAAGKTIKTAGLTLSSVLTFDGVGGSWTLQDDLTMSGSKSIIVTNGSFVSNNKSITANIMTSSNSNVRSISLGSSQLTCGINFAISTNLTFNAGTSTTTLIAKTCAGGGKTFNNVVFSGISSITGSNTFNTLTIAQGTTLSATSSTTQSVSSVSANGSAGNLITFQSVTSGTPATISVASGAQNFDHCTIKDMTFTGGATFTATNSVDGGGNSGITFLTHKVNGQKIAKVNGVTPSKVNGI